MTPPILARHRGGTTTVIQPEPGGLTAQNIEPEPCEGTGGTPPACLVVVAVDDGHRANLRDYPSLGNRSRILETLNNNTQVELIGYAIEGLEEHPEEGVTPTPTSSSYIWWQVRYTWLEEGIPQEIEGYIRADLLNTSGASGCDVPLVVPPPPPPPSDPGLCRFFTVVEETPIYRLPTTSSLHGFGTPLFSRNLGPGQPITVYGRTLGPVNDYAMLISDPAVVPPAQWEWVFRQGLSLDEDTSNDPRACDYSVLAAYPILDDATLPEELLFYRDNFQPPFASPSYVEHRNSQLFRGNNHNGLDIAFDLAQPFIAVPPYSYDDVEDDDNDIFGVIVDAGPDAFIYTSKVRQVFPSVAAIQPQWLRDRGCISTDTPIPFVTSCGRSGLYIQVTPAAGGVEVFIMYAMTAFHTESPAEYRNDDWTGENAGLLPDEQSALLTTYNIDCNPCTVPNQAGRQIVIEYDIDHDNIPDIEVVYIHILPNPAYPQWSNTDGGCSRDGPYRHDQWDDSSANADCWVNTSTHLGEIMTIGFSSGRHLHYTVYIDFNGDGAFHQNEQAIDPLIALAMIR
jgi:hypothetical protein